MNTSTRIKSGIRRHLFSLIGVATFFVTGLSISSRALAGKEGHGGNAVVCRDSAGKIKSAELLDFFEGRIIYGLKIQSSQQQIQLQLHQILNRLWSSNKDISGYMEPLFRDVYNNKNVLPDGVTLSPVDDSFPAVIPTGCKIEQLANYVNDQEILIDGEIWRALDLTNRAGLIVHESLYRFLRSFGETDSRRTRKVVAHLFSNFAFDDVYGGVPIPSQLCQSQYNEHYYKFFVYPTTVTDQTGSHIEPLAQFIWIDGQPQFSKKTASVVSLDGSFPSVGSGGSVATTEFEKGDVINFDFTPLDHGNIHMEISGTSGADPSRTYAKTTFSCQSYPVANPGPQPQDGLSASAIPSDPILVPYGSGTNIDGYFQLNAPYFILNQLQILWAGTGRMRLDTISLKSLDPKTTLSCVFRGDDLKVLYPQNVDSDGGVYFNQGSPAQASQPLGCEVSGLPSPTPDNFNIPVQIEIDGSVIGPNGYVGPSVATTTIHLN